MGLCRPLKSAASCGRGSFGSRQRLFSLGHVHDKENLYRRVPDDPRNFAVEGSHHRVSSAAFSDRSRQPSVDRAWLKGDQPRNSKKSPSDCVVGLITEEVRTKIDISPRDVDVVPDPIKGHATEPDNLAHALVITDPAFDNDSQFKRLKRALAKRCTMLILPGE